MDKIWQIQILINTKCHPLPFLQYSPLTEFCNQSTLGVFQIVKAPILTSMSLIFFHLDPLQNSTIVTS